MQRFELTFNVVVETEVPISKEISLDFNEYSELVTKATEVNHEERTIHVDKIDENDSDEINEMLFACLPPSVTKNCVSVSYTNIKLKSLDLIP
ncbi:hypothetical protein M2451_002737 [Dysgonomonas sp. PFB1-18]|uniref:hypothetical protein n=1 Tax=unclassified Dysgonomonas TaxID=2630389 RepID=UPI002474DEB2|nr:MULTISPECIES: hypothetical protein [unclassified Dysgonomonas]MDH6309377.1 hypothetical protein [Dysgonomonas sp. PF1-14]MDH6339758.1 hypothetical protein [Dysgonomonas sp. PF1-16]MDH6381406.1 hypothetical protein [Dysgonomonas sp. PFB1-18]MDH6398621.1 hypothetical protein [Dysgonomonas sp. PF1-23]